MGGRETSDRAAWPRITPRGHGTVTLLRVPASGPSTAGLCCWCRLLTSPSIVSRGRDTYKTDRN